jgi:aspartate/tyrosine/aromatic aminotransferase
MQKFGVSPKVVGSLNLALRKLKSQQQSGMKLTELLDTNISQTKALGEKLLATVKQNDGVAEAWAKLEGVQLNVSELTNRYAERGKKAISKLRTPEN